MLRQLRRFLTWPQKLPHPRAVMRGTHGGPGDQRHRPWTGGRRKLVRQRGKVEDFRWRAPRARPAYGKMAASGLAVAGLVAVGLWLPRAQHNPPSSAPARSSTAAVAPVEAPAAQPPAPAVKPEASVERAVVPSYAAAPVIPAVRKPVTSLSQLPRTTPSAARTDPPERTAETETETAPAKAKTKPHRERRPPRRTREADERYAGADHEAWRDRQVWRYREREERWMRPRSPWPFATFGFW